jgi:uncharacterized membrane-anchored protein
VLVSSGLAFTAGYFVYQMRAGGGKSQIVIEMVLALIASFLLGFGSLFVMSSFGLYV